MVADGVACFVLRGASVSCSETETTQYSNSPVEPLSMTDRMLHFTRLTNPIAATLCGTTLVLCFISAARAEDDVAGAYLGKGEAEWIKQADAESGDLRRQAYYALGRIQPPTAEISAALAAGLEDGEVVGRRYAMASLARMGPLAAPHLAAISAAMKGEQVDDTFIRLHGIHAMAAAGDASSEYTGQLKELLKAPQGTIRVAAAQAVWEIDQSPAAIDTLLALAAQDKGQKSPSPAVFEAVVALGKIGPQQQAVLPALIAALGHADADTRRAAADAIGKYDAEALKPLALATSKLQGEKSIDAAMAAGRIFDRVRTGQFHATSRPLSEFKETAGSVISNVAPALVNVLSQPGLNAVQRRQVGFQLSRMGEVGGFPLLKLLTTDDSDVRAAVIAAMQQMEIYLAPGKLENMDWVKQQLVKPMIQLLNHADADVRLATVRLFAALKPGAAGSAAAPALKRILRQPADAKAHPFAARALAQMRN